MADERKYYVLCESNCKFESMTKEQILAAITQAVESGKIQNVDTGFVTKLKEQNGGAPLSFWVGTQAQYNALGEQVENCFYIITDDATADDINNAISDIEDQLDKVELDTYKLGIESTEHKGCFYRMAGKEKEWINPPMAEGVEYRTTERDGNRVVYVKKLKFRTAQMGDSVTVDFYNTEYAQDFTFVGISGIYFDNYTNCEHQFPVCEPSNGAISGTLSVGTYEDDERYFWYIRQRTFTQFADYGIATVIVKYTKGE